MVAVEVVNDGGVWLMVEEGLSDQPLVESRGAVVGVARDEGEVGGRVGVAVPPGISQAGGGGEVLQLRGADQSTGSLASGGGGIMDGVDAVEVAAQEDRAVAVGGRQVSGKGGDEGEAWVLIAWRVGGDDGVQVTMECEVDAKSAAVVCAGADFVDGSAAAGLADEDGYPGGGASAPFAGVSGGGGAPPPEGPAWPGLARGRPRLRPLVAVVRGTLMCLLEADDVPGPVGQRREESAALVQVGEPVEVQ